MNNNNISYLTGEDLKRKISELFEQGLTYSQIRNELGPSTFDFPTFEVFLGIIGASSERDYRRIHANIERVKGKGNRRLSSGMQGAVPGYPGEEDDWGKIRKRVLESNLGACLFCDRNAEEVHHILGQKEKRASNYLIPVCQDHLEKLSMKDTKDGHELRIMAARMALIFPRLFFTVRKSIAEEDGGILSYPVVRIRNREQALMDDDPCPGWVGVSEVEGNLCGQGCIVIGFHLSVSETGFDLRIKAPE